MSFQNRWSKIQSDVSACILRALEIFLDSSYCWIAASGKAVESRKMSLRSPEKIAKSNASASPCKPRGTQTSAGRRRAFDGFRPSSASPPCKSCYSCILVDQLAYTVGTDGAITMALAHESVVAPFVERKATARTAHLIIQDVFAQTSFQSHLKEWCLDVPAIRDW